MATKFGHQNFEPLTEVEVQFPGVKGHVEVKWGQPGVKLLRNGLWQPNLVEVPLSEI